MLRSGRVAVATTASAADGPEPSATRADISASGTGSTPPPSSASARSTGVISSAHDTSTSASSTTIAWLLISPEALRAGGTSVLGYSLVVTLL